MSGTVGSSPKYNISCFSVIGVVFALWFIIAIFQALASEPIILTLVFIVVGMFALPPLVRYFRMKKYFGSTEFQQQKSKLTTVVKEHNEIASYAEEVRRQGLFDLGSSSTGQQAHLATYTNTSRHGYRRDRNVANYGSNNVHNCSLQVVRNAKSNPIKYLMKYFDLKPTEDHLKRVETLGSSIASLEGAIKNLHLRESNITRSINPPPFILKHYHAKFMNEVGVYPSPITIPYPIYRFEYVSAGGNSSQKTTIELRSNTIDALIETMSQKIRLQKSAAGQRALMTSKLRRFIKERDKNICQICGVSPSVEPTLLLEVDHIIPVSRGGLSSPGNLQTLCWRCNRTKSNKLAS